jgi:hypothetical protein
MIPARDFIVRLRTAAVNALRRLTKSCGPSDAGFFDTVLRQAQPGSHAFGSGARSGARAVVQSGQLFMQLDDYYSAMN